MGAKMHSCGLHIDLIMTSFRNHQYLNERKLLSYGVDRFEAFFLGHENVGNEQIKGGCLQQLQAFFPFLRFTLT